MFFRQRFSFILKKESPDVFYKKGVLKNFSKLSRKRLCWILIFSKVEGLNPATLLKKDRDKGVIM